VRIKGLPPESALKRKLRGPSADWDITAQLLRLIEFDLRGANWQRSGGKGQRPELLPMPGDETGQRRQPGPDVMQRLRNLGLLDDTGPSESGAESPSAPADPTPGAMWASS
jgi:hypothetical protein